MTKEYNQLQILRNIKEDISQTSLSKDIGFSIGKVKLILKALIEKGLVKSENFIASNNKIKYKYLLTTDGIKEKMTLTEMFIKKKKKEYEQLQAEIDTFRYGTLNNKVLTSEIFDDER